MLPQRNEVCCPVSIRRNPKNGSSRLNEPTQAPEHNQMKWNAKFKQNRLRSFVNGMLGNRTWMRIVREWTCVFERGCQVCLVQIGNQQRMTAIGWQRSSRLNGYDWFRCSIVRQVRVRVWVRVSVLLYAFDLNIAIWWEYNYGELDRVY